MKYIKTFERYRKPKTGYTSKTCSYCGDEIKGKDPRLTEQFEALDTRKTVCKTACEYCQYQCHSVTTIVEIEEEE